MRLLRNIGWKIVALALSMMLYFLVVGEPEFATVEAVPLVFQNLPSQFALISDPPEIVRLEMRGPSRAMARENLSGIKALLDLSEVKAPGERTFTLSESQITMPHGVTLVRVVPSQLRLTFDRLMVRNVPVEPRIAGLPAPGYVMGAHEVNPATVEISGPESRVRSVASALTDVVNIEGQKGPVEARVSAYLADPRVELRSAPLVTVKVNVVKGNSTPQK